MFYKSFCKLICIIFFSNVQKCLKICELNIIKKIKKDNKKKLPKNIKIFLKEKKRKNDNMVVNVVKISQMMKNKDLLSKEENIIE